MTSPLPLTAAAIAKALKPHHTPATVANGGNVLENGYQAEFVNLHAGRGAGKVVCVKVRYTMPVVSRDCTDAEYDARATEREGQLQAYAATLTAAGYYATVVGERYNRYVDVRQMRSIYLSAAR